MSDFLASLNPAPTRLPRPEPLAATITRRASHQAYYTIRWLVDRDRVANAYRAYGYFRWVDDRLDLACLPPAERLLFIERQRSLTDLCYQGQWPRPRSAEEELLVDLIRSDTELESGLQSYIRNMLAVMAFDVERRGRLVTRAELTRYTHWLAMAVTDALHYFIGHSCQHPIGQAQYLAASGAHIVHMLRDTVEDIRLGYFNIPREYIEAYHVDPTAIHTDPYRKWVAQRVHCAWACFAAGRDYVAQVHNLRCRLASYAYMVRFVPVLAAIEQADFDLAPSYANTLAPATGLRLLGALLRLVGSRQSLGARITWPPES